MRTRCASCRWRHCRTFSTTWNDGSKHEYDGRNFEQSVQRELARVIVGAEDVVRALCIALLARGHVLVQGPPGLGKTLLAKTLARVLGGEFKRVQGTADLMPSDIVGTHVFDSSKNEFVFRRGPLFADVLLVDEINRTGPKTQSALLEAMEERQVTSERDHYALPEDFLVLATQNPRDFEGTYPLPESQLDRFMLRIDMSYPERAAEGEILRRYGTELEARDPIPADLGAESIVTCCTRRAPPPAPCTCRKHCPTTCSTSRTPRASTRACRWACPRAALWLCSAQRACTRDFAAATSWRPTTCRPSPAGCWRIGWC